MSALVNGTSIAGLVPWLAGAVLGWQRARLWGSGLITLSYVPSLAIDLARGDGRGVLMDVVFGIIWGLIWWSEWRKRKRRDPAARSLGAKSRARVAALVERAREAAKPRRVLRPVPGGAGA